MSWKALILVLTQETHNPSGSDSLFIVSRAPIRMSSISTKMTGNGDDSHNKIKPLKVKVAEGYCDIAMDLDTGVSHSTITETVYRNNLSIISLI